MKIYLKFGLYIALSGFVLSLVFMLAGLYSTAAGMSWANGLQFVGHNAFGIAFIILAIRARRAAVPAGQAFGYGSAFVAGLATAIWTAVYDCLLVPFYLNVIAPHLLEGIIQAQIAKAEARGLSADQLDRAEKFIRLLITTPVVTAEAAIGAVVGGCIIALIAAAFLQKPAEAPRA